MDTPRVQRAPHNNPRAYAPLATGCHMPMPERARANERLQMPRTPLKLHQVVVRRHRSQRTPSLQLPGGARPGGHTSR